MERAIPASFSILFSFFVIEGVYIEKSYIPGDISSQTLPLKQFSNPPFEIMGAKVPSI